MKNSKMCDSKVYKKEGRPSTCGTRKKKKGNEARKQSQEEEEDTTKRR